MCLLNNCCCCCSLRTGSIFAAILTTVFAVLGIIPKIKETIKYAKDRKKSHDDDLTEEEIMCYVQLVFFALWIIFSIMLLIGVCTRARCCLLPWVIITCIMIIINIWILAMVLKQLIEDKADVTWDMVWSITQAVLSISFSIYLVMVVCSYFRRHLQEAVV